MHVHHDPPEKLCARSYERFLVNSPLQVTLQKTAFNVIFLLFLSLITQTRRKKIPEDKNIVD